MCSRRFANADCRIFAAAGKSERSRLNLESGARQSLLCAKSALPILNASKATVNRARQKSCAAAILLACGFSFQARRLQLVQGEHAAAENQTAYFLFPLYNVTSSNQSVFEPWISSCVSFPSRASCRSASALFLRRHLVL